jgi:hypothetical protein
MFMVMPEVVVDIVVVTEPASTAARVIRLTKSSTV